MEFARLLPIALLLVTGGMEVVATALMMGLMQEKVAIREKWRSIGVFKSFKSKLYDRLTSYQPCVNGGVI